jgi:hypothetical protein
MALRSDRTIGFPMHTPSTFDGELNLEYAASQEGVKLSETKWS